jgi:predicted porin
MKKSLIALAVAGAFAVPSAAMAVDVSFGGEFDLALDMVDNGDNTPGSESSFNQMNNTHSRFWWDMVDDLGTGLMVKGHLEIDVGAVGYNGGGAVNQPGAGGINNRNSYIGLAGESWGEVRFGTQENIHEATGYSVDPFHGAAGPGGNIVNGMGQSGVLGASQVFNGANIGARRTTQTITYISPNWSGFTFQVDYALEGANASATTPNQWNELFYGARYDGQFGNGGWRVYAAGADITNSGSVGAISGQVDMSGVRFGGGVTFGNFAIDAIWETNEWKDASTAALGKIERDGFWIGGSWMVPTGKVALGYIMMDDRDDTVTAAGAVDSSDTTNLAIGYYHTLSANSNVYIIYNTMDNGTNAAGQIQNTATIVTGDDPSALSLGMYLVF